MGDAGAAVSVFTVIRQDGPLGINRSVDLLFLSGFFFPDQCVSCWIAEKDIVDWLTGKDRGISPGNIRKRTRHIRIGKFSIYFVHLLINDTQSRGYHVLPRNLGCVVLPLGGRTAGDL